MHNTLPEILIYLCSMIKQQMASSGKSQLMQAFNDPTYAWELLEWEIAIEMNESLSGQAIAHLLELYMRGVEKMNSLMDIRESYFKNKVTSLMMKGNVVKTLNKPPMAKKQKPLQIAAKKEEKGSKQKPQAKVTKKQEESPLLKATVQPNNTLALQQKRRELEMRLAYEADSSSRQNLANMYNQHVKKEQNYNSKVKNLLNDHEEKLKERINRRKLRTATYRSRPEDTSDTFPIEQSNVAVRHQCEEPFSPREKQMQKEGLRKGKRHHSLEVKAMHELKVESPTKRQRKNTHDLTQSKKREDDRMEQISKFEEFKKAVQLAKKREDDQQLQLVINGGPEVEKQGEGELQKLKEARQSV